MGEVSTIGLDIAKSVFQAHGVDVDGIVVIRKRISRAKVLKILASYGLAWWEPKHLRQRSVGAASFKCWVIRTDTTQYSLHRYVGSWP